MRIITHREMFDYAKQLPINKYINSAHVLFPQEIPTLINAALQQIKYITYWNYHFISSSTSITGG